MGPQLAFSQYVPAEASQHFSVIASFTWEFVAIDIEYNFSLHKASLRIYSMVQCSVSPGYSSYLQFQHPGISCPGCSTSNCISLLRGCESNTGWLKFLGPCSHMVESLSFRSAQLWPLCHLGSETVDGRPVSTSL